MTLKAVCCFHLFNHKPPGQLPLSKRTLKRLEWHPVNKSQIYYIRIWVSDGRNNMTLHLAPWSKRNKIFPWYIQRIIRVSGQSFLTNTLAGTGINRGIGCGSRHSHGHRKGVHIRAKSAAKKGCESRHRNSRPKSWWKSRRKGVWRDLKTSAKQYHPLTGFCGKTETNSGKQSTSRPKSQGAMMKLNYILWYRPCSEHLALWRRQNMSSSFSTPRWLFPETIKPNVRMGRSFPSNIGTISTTGTMLTFTLISNSRPLQLVVTWLLTPNQPRLMALFRLSKALRSNLL